MTNIPSFLVLTIIAVLTQAVITHPTAAESAAPRFHFSDYKNYADNQEAEARAQEDLSRSFPVGSDARMLRQSLTDAGATCRDEYVSNRGRSYLYCTYSYSVRVIITIEWKILGYVDPATHEITGIVARRGATSF